MENGEKEKLRQVEKRVESIDLKVDKILENHLPHIQQEIASLKARVWVVIGVGGFVIGVLTNYIMDKL